MPTRPCVFFMLLLFYVVVVSLVIIHPPPAHAHAHSHSKCNQSFHCGHLGILEFPFTEFHNPQCGLFFLNCTSSPPLIQFGSGGDWLQFLHNNASANKFRVRDSSLVNNVSKLDPGKCLPMGTPYNNSNPPFPLDSLSISPNITVVSCPKNSIPPSEYDLSQYCQTYPHCDAFELYYGDEDPHCHDVIEGNSDIPKNCSVLHLPGRALPSQHGGYHLELSPEYEVQWHVSPGCKSCLHRGGICFGNVTTHQFHCNGAKRDQQTLMVILLAVICGSAFLVLCFVVPFLICRRHRKNKLNGPYLLSRSISSGPSSTSDLQLGGGRFFFGILVFSYQELQEATNNFDPSKELGEGGFGIVYYGKLRDGREVAIKRLYEHNCRRVEQFLNEIKILADLRHPNLVTLFGCASRRIRELLLVYEYIPNGTVADHLHGEMAQTSPLTWPVRMTIAVETASALAYLHKKDIIHRDVKTYNILLDNNFSVKVADFGLSRLFPNDVSHISTAPQGTPGYVDPEYHQCYQLTDKSDVYSFGVVLIELISSMPPVDITRHRHEINLANLAMDRIQRCAFDELIDSSLGHQTDAEVARMTMSVAELAFRCLQHEKDLRPSMDEVLEFLTDIQAGEDCNLEKKERSNGKYFVPGKLITSPETDDAVLLKGNMPSSPVTVTNTWPSGSTTTSSMT